MFSLCLVGYVKFNGTIELTKLVVRIYAHPLNGCFFMLKKANSLKIVTKWLEVAATLFHQVNIDADHNFKFRDFFVCFFFS